MKPRLVTRSSGRPRKTRNETRNAVETQNKICSVRWQEAVPRLPQTSSILREAASNAKCETCKKSLYRRVMFVAETGTERENGAAQVQDAGDSGRKSQERYRKMYDRDAEMRTAETAVKWWSPYAESEMNTCADCRTFQAQNKKTNAQRPIIVLVQRI